MALLVDCSLSCQDNLTEWVQILRFIQYFSMLNNDRGMTAVALSSHLSFFYFTGLPISHRWWARRWSKKSPRVKRRKCHKTAQGKPISFARTKAWPKLKNTMNKWHALFHMDLLWFSLCLLTLSFSYPLQSQRHVCTNGSFWNESRIFLLLFVWAVKNVPSLLLCKCPLLCWWIFAGWIQQQALIEFSSIRLISNRHMELSEQMHKNIYL